MLDQTCPFCNNEYKIQTTKHQNMFNCINCNIMMSFRHNKLHTIVINHYYKDVMFAQTFNIHNKTTSFNYKYTDDDYKITTINNSNNYLKQFNKSSFIEFKENLNSIALNNLIFK